MKIAVTIFSSAPLAGRLKLEVESLLEAGHDLTVVFAQGNRTGRSDDDRYDIVSLGFEGSKLRRVLGLGYFYRTVYTELCRVKPDAIHCAHPFLLPPAVSYKRATGAGLVYDPFEMYCLTWSTYMPFARPLWQRMFEAVENHFVSSVDAVVTIDTRASVLEKRYRKVIDAVEVLLNVTRLATNVDPRLAASLAGKYQDQPLVAYVGSIEAVKGMDVTIEAVARVREAIPGVRLLLIGPLIEPQRWEATKARFAEFVELIPTLPYDKMMAYLQLARVGLAPYQPTWQYPDSRGNSRKLFTYMQAGLPIVGPEFGELGFVVREEGCGILVDTTSAEDIAAAIEKLLREPEWARELGERGRRAVIEKYNWELEQKKLLTAYARVAASGVAGPAMRAREGAQFSAKTTSP